MASSTLEEVVRARLYGLSSRPHLTGVIHVDVCTTTSFETEPTAWRRSIRLPLEDFTHDEETAIHSSRQMLLSEPMVEREVIPNAAAQISVMLRSFAHSAMQRGYNVLYVEVDLRIVRVSQGSPHHHHLLEQPEASDDSVGLGFDSDFDEDDAAFLDDEDEEDAAFLDDEDEEDAAMDWATTESMNSDIQYPSSSHCHMHQVESFLTSCRAQTWDSNTQCIICLECLGTAAAGLQLQEDQHQDAKGGGNKELEVMICKLPCSHLFHGQCISKWFQGRDTCPICRRTFHPSHL